MTTGAVILAFNNEETDYVAMAAWSAGNIRRHLGISTSVITDCTDSSKLTAFDKVITTTAQTGGSRYFEDYNQTVSWHNAGRTDVYNLTPYDQTLVLDADYVVASDTLKQVLRMSQDFVCHKDAINLAGATPLVSLNTFGDYKMPMYWATVMMFRKSNTAQYIFDCMQMIKSNWQHYRDLYGIKQSNYRNDYALSIALGIVSGHTLIIDAIPWDLLSIMPGDKLEIIDTDFYEITYLNSLSKLHSTAVRGLDFHAMGKKHLESVIANNC
jgi:hypothetical protein